MTAAQIGVLVGLVVFFVVAAAVDVLRAQRRRGENHGLEELERLWGRGP